MNELRTKNKAAQISQNDLTMRFTSESFTIAFATVSATVLNIFLTFALSLKKFQSCLPDCGYCLSGRAFDFVKSVRQCL
jgi:biotin synthase-like enzyme